MIDDTHWGLVRVVHHDDRLPRGCFLRKHIMAAFDDLDRYHEQ